VRVVQGSQHSSGFGIQHDDLVTGGIGDVEMAEDRIGNDRSRGSADVPVKAAAVPLMALTSRRLSSRHRPCPNLDQWR